MKANVINIQGQDGQNFGQERQLTPILKLKLTFSNLDQNNTGFINKEDLQKAIMYTGDNYDKDIIRQQIEKCEEKISLQKFIQLFQMAEIQINTLMENQSLFKLYDKDRKGYIDKQDLKRVSQIAGVQLTQVEMAEMLDYNTTPGRVHFDQFAQIMNDRNAWF